MPTGQFKVHTFLKSKLPTSLLVSCTIILNQELIT